MMRLLTALLGLMALAVQPTGAHAASGEDSTRSLIEASIAAHPENAAVQDSARRALAALDAWERAVQDMATAGEVSSSRGVGAGAERLVVGPAAYPNPMRGMDSWNVNGNRVALSVARQDWTVGERYRGTVASLDARFSLRRSTWAPAVSDCDCDTPPPAPHQAIGTVRTSALWGEDGLERGSVGLAVLSLQRNFEPPDRGWRPLRDTLELGAAVRGMDDALGLDSYSEITLARFGRTWGWRPGGRAWMVMAGVGFSAGWAWADSAAPTYNDVSNPVVGSWVTLGVARPGWGKIYLEQRAINGFQFSSPSAGGSTSREARFRFGIIKTLPSCLSLELFIDKRSFNFSDHRLPDLYTKAKRTGVEVGCAW